MTTETQNTTETTLATLEAQIVRLPAQAHLQLVARISERLSDATPDAPRSDSTKIDPPRGERPQAERGKRRLPTPFKRPTNDTDEAYAARVADIDAFLAACDDIAKDSTGTFDSVADIRRMRDEDDG